MGRQTPKYFLQAVRSLIETKTVEASDIIVRFVGHFDESVLTLFNKFSPFFSIEVIKFQPYAETIRLQTNSLLLLLIVNIEEDEGGSQTMTGKFFEYIGAKRPIIALVPNGPLKETIVKGRFGTVSPPKNVSKIANRVSRLYHEWKSNGTIRFDPDTDLRNSFGRKQLTGKLASIIDNIV